MEDIPRPDPEVIQTRMLSLLEELGIEHRLYHHRPVLSYEDAELSRQESGFEGTEGKVLICRAGDGFAAFVTMQGTRLNTKAVKRILGVGKVRVAAAEDLDRYFAATPGAAYPFGFDASFPILVDPAIYTEAWLLYSMPLVTTTLQISGREMRRVLEAVENDVYEIT